AGPLPARRGRRILPTIDRYLLRHLLVLTGSIAASLMVVFTLFYAINLIDDLARGERPVSLLFVYLLYVQPQALLNYVAPISLCIGTLVTFALLARTHELVAIRAGGIGLFRVAAPFLLTSTLLALTAFIGHDRLLPVTNQKANEVLDQIRRRSPRSYRQPARRWVFGSQGLLYNFSDFNPRRGELQDLSIFRFRPGTFDIEERLFAEKAIWEQESWSLKEGWVRTFGGTGERYRPFGTHDVSGVDPPGYFVQDWKAPDQMNFSELRRHVRDLERRGYDTRELRVGLHRKIAIPMVCIVMVITGLPFAARVERRGPVFAIALSVLLVFVYYTVLQLFGEMGEIAVLPPVLAAWAPNILFGGAGLYAVAMARW
ncbi:MAG TPA: LptF/LptG family permease, partial [Candidatus Polarisedimenticolia bacterium]|nr:LptF/LptG family permease [Candidatus Polarisedimenticolia bacterium]